jgi:hypothetical protein
MYSRQYILSAILLLVAPVHSSGNVLRNLLRLGTRSLQSTDVPLIVTIIDSTTNLEELCYTFQSLVNAKASALSPINAFHGISLEEADMETLAACTNRDVIFSDISDHYNEDIPGFDKVPEQNYDAVLTESFFLTKLWTRSELEDYEVIFRVSDTTCIARPSDELPDFPDDLQDFEKDVIVYKNHPTADYYPQTDLYRFTREYIDKNEVEVLQQEQWDLITNQVSDFNSMPYFDVSVEVVRKRFMTSEAVRRFYDNMTVMHSDIFYNDYGAWGVLRFVTFAIFAEYEEVPLGFTSGLIKKNFGSDKFFPTICRFGDVGSAPFYSDF